jgi:parallel beta-helix repeat protein
VLLESQRFTPARLQSEVGDLPEPTESRVNGFLTFFCGAVQEKRKGAGEKMKMLANCLLSIALLPALVGALPAAEAVADFSPKPEERQLPRAMHSAMDELPRITVGLKDADLVGSDNRVLQAAVDYVAGLGGGVVDIGAGVYLMRDSLHLHSRVTVRGKKEQTILRKAPAAVSPLGLDGDFGEEQVTLKDPDGFAVGCGIAIWDDRAHGFHTTVARIVGRRGNTFAIDRPLMADCMMSNHAQAATVFPVISGYDIEEARVEDLVVDGNRKANVSLDGCRGAGIFLYRGFGTVIRGCVVRNYHGDGISFQQSNDVSVLDCLSEGNAGLGLHPGSGSQRPVVRGCTARRNGTDGLFLCWRVRHGTFENNLLEANGRYGISIGHKDSDNTLRRNQVRGNGEDGVCFRNESLGMAAHRNCLEENTIEDNGRQSPMAGIRIRGETDGLLLRKNIIRDTRAIGRRTQTIGILIEENVGTVTLEENQIDAQQAPVDDRRKNLGPPSR